MGFFDAMKKVAERVDEGVERIVRKMTDEQLLEAIKKHPEKKYYRKEAERRGLL